MCSSHQTYEDTCPSCKKNIFFKVKDGNVDHRHTNASGEKCRFQGNVKDGKIQLLSGLMKKYKDEKIIKTSFLDDGFMKTLASAIRFGTVLLVQDVEDVDPILNPILNKELMRTGGRTLVRLGAEEIDYR